MELEYDEVDMNDEFMNPAVTIRDGDYVLVPFKDYVCVYTDNMEAGTAKVSAYGIGNYTDVLEGSFTIKVKSVKEPEPQPQENNTISDNTVSDNRIVSENEADYPADPEGMSFFFVTGGSTYDTVSKNKSGKYEVTYTGAPIKPLVKVFFKGHELYEGTDFTVKYKNNRNVTSSAEAIITGKGMYKCSYTLKFKIVKKNLRGTGVAYPAYFTAKGDKDPKILIAYNGNLLKTKDYSLKIEKDKVTVSGKGNFTGDITIPIDRNADAGKQGVKLTLARGIDVSYTGEKIKLNDAQIIVKDGAKNVLVKDRDYKVFYSNNVNAGKAKVTVVGIDSYTGISTKTFKIKGNKSGTVGAPVYDANVTYSIAGSRPVVSINCAGRALIAGRDYKLVFAKKNRTGEASFSVKFLGNYKGQKGLKKNSYTVTTADFKEGVVSVNAAYMNVDGKGKVTPKVFVDEKGILLNDKSYSVELFIDGKPVVNNMPDLKGATYVYAELKVTGRGNYNAMSITKRVKIYAPAKKYEDISKAKIRVYESDKDVKTAKSFAFTGKKIKPGKTEVVFKNMNVKNKVTVKYYNNLNKGKAVVVALGKGSGYTGAAVGSYKIK